MSAIPYEGHEEERDGEEQETLARPGRPRRQLFNRRSASLLALVVGVIGFYAGVRVEKGQLSSSSSTGSSLPSLAGSGASSRGATGTSSGSRSSLPALGAFGGGGTSIGTVSNINGKTIYISDSSGNTVKVQLSSATKITKSLTVGKKAVRPGDSVVIRGAKSSNGTLSATSISDSGASTTGSGSTGSGSTGTSSSSTSSGSGVSSLFGSGSG
jgi:hypothetical protein